MFIQKCFCRERDQDSRCRVGVLMCSHHHDAGPAAYMLPSVLGPGTVCKTAAPNYSLCGRSKVGSFHEDLQKVSPCYCLEMYHCKYSIIKIKCCRYFLESRYSTLSIRDGQFGCHSSKYRDKD